MNGTQLALSYGLKVSELKYCGPLDASQKVYGYLAGKSDSIEAGKLLRGFDTMHSYLSLIAERNGMAPEDYEVAEAYWLGNGLLEKVDESDIRKMLREKFAGKFPEGVLNRFISTLPKGCAAHHSLHVFHVGAVSKTSPQITRGNIGKCIVSWGEVTGVSGGSATVAKRNLEFTKRGMGFGQLEEVQVPYPPELVSPKKGQNVSMHWDNVVQALSDTQLANLKKYTLQNIGAVNRSTAHHF